MRKLKPRPNLNKIKLYAILHNIINWSEVPACFNCKYGRICGFDNPTHIREGRKFSYNSDFRRFVFGWRLQYKDRGCAEWELGEQWKKKS